ncbi:MAG TPA: I78 family peptidase inhibitor [Sphingomonadaceae bacterium]
MHSRIVLAAGCALWLAACAGTGGAPAPDEHARAACDQAPGQAFVGRMATADTASELLRATGARTLRWAPPRTAITMDYRFDRLTVGYDDDLTITRVSCG